MLRLFLAIPIPHDVKNKILRWQMGMARYRIFWIPDSNLHVTLLFLGNVREENVEPLQHSLQKIFADVSPFSLDFEKICVKNKNMIWALFEQNESFLHLFKMAKKTVFPFLEESLRDTRDQIPHITLARSKSLPHLEISQIVLPQVEVQKIELWRSELAQPNAKYSVLKSFVLKK